MGYLGSDKASRIVLNGLKKLQDKDCNTSGIAVIENELNFYSENNSVEVLEKGVLKDNAPGHIAIGHACSKDKKDDNHKCAQTSQSGSIVLVNGGYIKNKKKLEAILLENGYNLENETDAKILNHYISLTQIKYSLTIEETVKRVVSEIDGQYTFFVVDTLDPSKVIVSKNEAPLVIGLKDNSFFIATNEKAVLEYTNELIPLEDKECAVLKLDGTYTIQSPKGKSSHNELDFYGTEMIEDYNLDGYESHMLKEIFEQPVSLRACSRNRLNGSILELDAVDDYKRVFKMAQRIIIVGSASSYNCALIGKYIFEKIAKIPTHVEYSSEFRAGDPLVNENDLVLFISRSGETIETLEAIKKANEKGAFTYSIVNNPTSTITYYSDIVSSLNIGLEEGIVSTKSFTATVSLLTMIALKTARIRDVIDQKRYEKKLVNLALMPDKVSKILDLNSDIKELTSLFKENNNVLFLGQGINIPLALEAAYKLNKVSYLNSTAHPTEEIKKGAFKQIVDVLPIFIFCNNEKELERIYSTIDGIDLEKGKVVLILNGKVDVDESKFTSVLSLPKADKLNSPLTSSVFIQLLSYHIAKQRNNLIDSPKWYEDTFNELK